VAPYHPQIVHFVIALLVVGVIFRLLSLAGRPAFLGPAAFTLLLVGTIGSFLAVRSGDAAHGPVERIPGVRPAVIEHEEWGERTRNIFVIVIAIEALGLAMWRSPRRRMVLAASAVAGLVGLYALYETGEHGGELVYSYAGGVGIRSGDPQDVRRLLLAGLYQQAQVDRREGRAADAAVLISEAARRFPDNVEVQLLAAESLLLDKKDPQAALTALRLIEPPRDNRPIGMRHTLLTADALVASGQRDGAIAVLQGFLTAYPDAARVKERLGELERGR
jgi:uncharacterized membrane protein